MLEGKKFSDRIDNWITTYFKTIITIFVVSSIANIIDWYKGTFAILQPFLGNILVFSLLASLFGTFILGITSEIIIRYSEMVDNWYDKRASSRINHRRVKGVIIGKSTNYHEVIVRLSPSCIKSFHLDLEDYFNIDNRDEVTVLVDDYLDKKGQLFRRDFKLEKLQASAM